MTRADSSEHKAASTGGRRPDVRPARRRLGERIKSAREKMGLTQGQVAKILGISRGAVGQWEIGLGAPATERLGMLSGYLGVSLDWLLDNAEQAGGPGAAGAAAQGATMEGAAMAGAAMHDLLLLEEARQLGVNLPLIVAEARERRRLDANREAPGNGDAF
jgi:transcriptional regulator with XRE-family HTH domain